MHPDGLGGPELLIAAASVVPAVAGSSVMTPGYVAIAGGVITDVGAGPPPRAADLELSTGALLPGLVDLQVNGHFGVDLQTAEADGWAQVATRLPETGTTAFLPTFITAPIDELSAALRSAVGLVPDLSGGARVLGVHVEGPFIAPDRRGAHNEAWITTASPEAVTDLLEAGRGLLKMVTLAPERNGGMAAIDQFTQAGVLVSVGHSDATARQVASAADRGARMVTHLFNGQRPLHHREAGVVGQALADRRLTSGLVADLWHVCAEVCGIVFAAAPGRICIVTDAAACRACRPGTTCSVASRSSSTWRWGASGTRRRHAGRLGTADGHGRGQHDHGWSGAGSCGRRGHPDSGQPDRQAGYRPDCPGGGCGSGVAG